MSDVTLYGFAMSTFVRTARMALHEKGVDYTLKNEMPGSEALAGLHPFGKIPIMTHGTDRIFECLGICTYVDGVFDGPLLTPANPVARAHMFQWISVHNDAVMKPFMAIARERMIKPMMMQEQGDEAIVAEAMPKMVQAVDVLNEALGASDYLAGPNMSIADLFVLPVIEYLPPAGCANLLDGRGALKAWAEKMGARDSAIATRPQAPDAAVSAA